MLLVLYLYELVCYSYVLVSCFSHNPKIPPQSEYMRKFPFQKNRRLKISLTAIFLLCIIFCSLKLVGNYFLYSPYHIWRNHSDSVSDDTSKVLPSRLVSDFINGPKYEKEKFKLLTIKNISRFFRSVLRMKMGKDFFQENCLTIFLSGKLGEF